MNGTRTPIGMSMLAGHLVRPRKLNPPAVVTEEAMIRNDYDGWLKARPMMKGLEY